MITALKCSQCGAGVARAAGDRELERECDYCGSVLRMSPDALDDARHGHQASDSVCPKQCPRCHHRTVKTDVSHVHLRACHHCGGVWIPRKGLKRLGSLSKRHLRKLRKLNQSKVRRGTVHVPKRHGKLHCPRCAHTMVQRQYSKGTRITVDVCEQHGAWFDEHELRAAHRDIARRLGMRSDGKRWEHALRFRGDWQYDALYILFRVLAEIIDELFD